MKSLLRSSRYLPGLVAALAWTAVALAQAAPETTYIVQSASLHSARTQVRRVGADELLLTYASERRLCALARGLVEGFGAYFSERITTTEDACMLHGADACSIRIVRKGAATAR